MFALAEDLFNLNMAINVVMGSSFWERKVEALSRRLQARQWEEEEF